MNKTQIDCFLSAARTGSVTAAASACYLSVQVVSQHILNLEKELGTILFNRSKTGVSLTENGERFYTYAEKWTGLYESTMRRIGEYYSSLSASFHIGVSEYVDVMGNIAGGIRSFREKYPRITMTGSQYKNRILLKQVENGYLDVAVINELQISTGDDFDHMRIAREDLRLYISNSRDKQPADPSIIPHISSSYGVWDTSDWEEVSHRMTQFLGHDFSRHLEAANFRSCVLNLRTIPCSIVCDARFGYLPPDNEYCSIPIKEDSWLCVLWHKKNENPLIRKFSEHMKTYYADIGETF